MKMYMLENDLSQIQEHVMNWHGWGWLVCLVLFLLRYRFYMLLQLVFLACCLKMKNTNKAKSTSGEPEGVRQVREAPRYIRTRRPRLCIQAGEFLLQKKNGALKRMSHSSILLLGAVQLGIVPCAFSDHSMAFLLVPLQGRLAPL